LMVEQYLYRKIKRAELLNSTVAKVTNSYVKER
jgi:hypothetical protein